MVICLERGADLHIAQLMPLPLTVSCSRKIQIGLTFLVLAHLGSPGQTAVKRVCVCVGISQKFLLRVVRVAYGSAVGSVQEGAFALAIKSTHFPGEIVVAR